MSNKKEIFYIVCVIALIAGAYFFIHNMMFPKPKSFAVYTKPKVDREKQRDEYYERRNRILDAQFKREKIKYERDLKNIKPVMDFSIKYYEEIEARIAKLPPYKRNNQKEVIKAIQEVRSEYMYKKIPGQVHNPPKINR